MCDFLHTFCKLLYRRGFVFELMVFFYFAVYILFCCAFDHAIVVYLYIILLI